MQFLNLGVRFLLELCALAALGYWGLHTETEASVRIGLGIGAPLLAAAVWGLFVAPKATRRLPDPWRLLAELAVWMSATAALIASGQTTLAWIFGVAVALNLGLMVLWRQRGTA